MASAVPTINLICHNDKDAKAFEKAIQTSNLKPPHPINYTIHPCSLSQLDAILKFDLIVSPANSYGILDGGFDDAISRAFSPTKEYYALTHHVQLQLYDQYRGFLPPGNCHLVKLPAEWREQKLLKYGDGTGWGAKYIAICPTMRMPSSAKWDKEVVYECIWSLLCAVDRHNRGAGNEKIESLLMSPLATGVGDVSSEKWAEQVVLAMKHFQEAVENPYVAGKHTWASAGRMAALVASTHKR